MAALDVSESAAGASDGMLRPVKIDQARIGETALNLDEAEHFAQSTVLIQEGFPAECFVPATVLRNCSVVFDYPARRFGASRRGVRSAQGTAVHCPMGRGTGWPAVEVEVCGRQIPMLLDTGASCCMLSSSMFTAITEHLAPECRATGAVGIANMSAGLWESDVEIARIPSMRFGPIELRDVVLASRPEGNFERMMSSGTAIPVLGALAGNALQWSRIELFTELDVAYVALGDGVEPSGDAMDLVPLVLQITSGRVVIHGVANRHGRPLLEGVRSGDRLVAIDGQTVDGLNFGGVVDLLRGRPGQTKRLDLDRGGSLLELTAPVTRVI